MSPNPGKNSEASRKSKPEGKFQNKISENRHSESPSKSGKALDIFSNLMFWGEKYDSSLERFFSKLPIGFGSFVATVGMFVLGITARGEWVLFAAYFMKYLSSGGSENYIEDTDKIINSFQDWISVRLDGFLTTWAISAINSYVIYFGIGGFLHWYYYVRRRHEPENWKCQPKQWLSPELERHEIMLGSFTMILGSCIMAALATYVKNGGWSTVYFGMNDFGYIWFLAQIPIIYIYQDYITYWNHRLFHIPWLYKHFHKLHHTYKQPTAFSVTAIHPVEFIYLQICLILPVFFIPVHWFNMSALLMYIYYHGLTDHSGINFKRQWWQPWQPDTMFHDNHHQYFHVNFGFNLEIWDFIHGTYRRKDRIYREDIFYGYGKSLEESSVDERKQDIAERESENPFAYQNNTMPYDLSKLVSCTFCIFSVVVLVINFAIHIHLLHSSNRPITYKMRYTKR